MQIAVFGVNLENSKTFFHEKFLLKVKSYLPHYSLIPLITCNRFEIYISSGQFKFLKRVFYDFLKKDIEKKTFQRSYLYFGYNCFDHLCKTTAGLNSAILGESEIQRQVKLAYLNASVKKLPFSLHFLFQKALKIGKQVRTTFSFQNKNFSLPFFIYEQVRKFYVSPSILLVGNSQINRSVKNFFINKKMSNITIASRYLNSIEGSLGFDKLDQWPNYDIVIAATKLSKKCIFPNRVDKQIFLFDLSVPSVIDPAVAEDSSVTFWSLQKINSFFSRKKSNHLELIDKCIKEVERQVSIQREVFEKKEQNRLTFQEKAS